MKFAPHIFRDVATAEGGLEVGLPVRIRNVAAPTFSMGRVLSELNRMPPLWSKILLPSTYNESKRQPQITDWNHRRGRDRKTTASARFQTPIRSGNRCDFKLHLRKRGKVLPGKCSDRCAHR